MRLRITQSTQASLSSLLLILLVTIPVLVHAGNTGPNGLIPCTDDCKFSDAYRLGKNIMDFLLFDVAVPLSAALFTYAGILYVYSAWDPGQRNKAKSVLKSTVFGLIIAFSGWLVVTTIINVLTDGSIQPA